MEIVELHKSLLDQWVELLTIYAIRTISVFPHSVASSYWGVVVLLGLSRRQYKVYKKISPTNMETLIQLS